MDIQYTVQKVDDTRTVSAHSQLVTLQPVNTQEQPGIITASPFPTFTIPVSGEDQNVFNPGDAVTISIKPATSQPVADDREHDSDPPAPPEV